MTQDELNLVLDALKWCHGGEPCGTAEAIAVVEKALAQPEQEPAKDWVASHNAICALLRQAHDALALTSYPMKRIWVGLTNEDISKISQRLGIDHDDSWKDLKQAIEAKLKQKNG